MATEHAGQATAAAEQSRLLLAEAAHELSRLENENQLLQQQVCLLLSVASTCICHYNFLAL